MKRTTGYYTEISSVGEKCRAFIPHPLPPDPPIEVGELRAVSEAALLGLGRLDTLEAILPDIALFLYMYVRKEAVLSSQIEGTQSTLSDLLLFESDEAPGAPLDDVKTVSNYVKALDHGLNSELPISSRLIREMHSLLLEDTRGADKHPGEYRRSQNWIGGSKPGNATFVPPPPDTIQGLMGSLEQFIHSPYPSVLEKAALSHLQFETIHPFLDGNGRIGRLLLPIILRQEGVLKAPSLYLSLYFKNNRDRYYRLLQKVRTEGDWEEWLTFFYEGVRSTSEQACSTAMRLRNLFNDDTLKIRAIGRPAGSILQIHELIQAKPILGPAKAAEFLPLSGPTIRSSFERLESLGIVREITGGSRNRVYAYTNYMAILNEGIE